MQATLEHRPDVVLLDLALPRSDAITAEPAGRLPGCRVLILTGQDAAAT